jgi:hypothetical protein
METPRTLWLWQQVVEMARNGLVDDAELARRERLVFGAANPRDFRDLDREDFVRDHEVMPEDPS